MNLAFITAQQVAVSFILIFTGFICIKGGSIKGRKEMLFLTLKSIYLIVPAMIINSYITEFND